MNPWQPSSVVEHRDPVHWAIRVYGALTLMYALWTANLALPLLLLQDLHRTPPFGLVVAGCLALATLGIAPGLAALLGLPQARPLFLAWSSVVLLAVALAFWAFEARVRAHPAVFVIAGGWPAMCLVAFTWAFAPRPRPPAIG